MRGKLGLSCLACIAAFLIAPLAACSETSGEKAIPAGGQIPVGAESTAEGNKRTNGAPEPVSTPGAGQAQQTTPEAGPQTVNVSKEHSALLERAARVSSVTLVCHRDMWDFVAAHAGLHAHFRVVPSQIADRSGERVGTVLSGRSLVAVLISLYNVMHTADQGSGDREMATALYERIRRELAEPTAEGQSVTITVDDRAGSGADDADGTPRPTSGPPTGEPEAEGEPGAGTPTPQPSESQPEEGR